MTSLQRHPSANGGGEYLLEERADGTTLVLTGRWSGSAVPLLASGSIQRLVINYARGFEEHDLGFLEDWPLRAVEVLDRSIVDVEPLGRLSANLLDLSLEVSPEATLDPSLLPNLRAIAASWPLVAQLLDPRLQLTSIRTSDFPKPDLVDFDACPHLNELVIKGAPRLESLHGLEALRELHLLHIALARRLSDISAVAALAESIRTLRFDTCPKITSLEPIRRLTHLTEFWIANCGLVDSLQPISNLVNLTTFRAWESTDVADDDLSPLLALTRLRDLRMRARAKQQPPLAEIKRQLGLGE